MLSVSFETRNSFIKQFLVGEMCEFMEKVCEKWASEENENLQKKLFIKKVCSPFHMNLLF